METLWAQIQTVLWNVFNRPTIADVLEELDALLEPGDAVLVKASHFMGLTRIVEGLVN